MLRKKILLIIFLSIGVFTVLLYVVSSQILVKSYEDIEQKQMIQNLTRIDQAIKGYSKVLGVKLLDWVQWDDTYYFATNANEEFIESNLDPSTLVNLEINFIAVMNTKNEIVFSEYVDLETEEKLPSEKKVLSILQILSNGPSLNEDTTGCIIKLDNRLLFIETLPIVTSEGEGPSTGTLLFARFVDDDFLDYVRNLTQLSVEIFQEGELSIPINDNIDLIHKEEFDGYMVEPLSSSLISGHFPLYNPAGQPIGTAYMESIRETLIQGKKTVFVFSIISSIALLLLGVIILILFGVILLSRLEHLAKDVEEISLIDLGNASVDEGKNDEVGILARKINLLLSTLAKSQEEREKIIEVEKTTSNNLKSKLKEIKEINKIMVGRELKMIELKKEIKKLYEECK